MIFNKTATKAGYVPAKYIILLYDSIVGRFGSSKPFLRLVVYPLSWFGLQNARLILHFSCIRRSESVDKRTVWVRNNNDKAIDNKSRAVYNSPYIN